MTLLLVFFVLMFSMSTVETERFEEMLSSLQTAFGDGGRRNAIIELTDNAQQLAATNDAELTTKTLPPTPAQTLEREGSSTPSISSISSSSIV